MSLRVLGISCSLRNARFGAGSVGLVRDLITIASQEELKTYLEQQTRIRAQDFLKAGRKDNKAFDKIYLNLKKSKGTRGLSNSEAALAAGLWGAHRAGAEIIHCGLSNHFPNNGPPVELDKLRAQILDADALLLSGPVYFGDRSSIAQAFIEFLREDKACAQHIRGRVYAGISVGAKRNGGQETTLIYQMVDLTNMYMLAVGNDDQTTSQYGGTVVAGDVGTMHKDDYGLATSIGTGRRIASASKLLEEGHRRTLNSRVHIGVWLLQDNQDHWGRVQVEKYCTEVESRVPNVQFNVIDFTEESIQRCIACDVCPSGNGDIDKYRCAVKSNNDLFMNQHKKIIDNDAILLAAYSPIDRKRINSVYQQFIERTRYLRRDDYALGDCLSAPLVISEVGSNQNLHIRMMTSLVRHQHIIHHPLIGMVHQGKILNRDSFVDIGVSFAENAIHLTAGRMGCREFGQQRYNPIGYEISDAVPTDEHVPGRNDSPNVTRATMLIKRHS